jgi:hypothetical protein
MRNPAPGKEAEDGQQFSMASVYFQEFAFRSGNGNRPLAGGRLGANTGAV